MRQNKKYSRNYLFAIVYILIVTLVGVLYSQKLENKISKEITASSERSLSEEIKVIPCGMTVGIYVETEGVLVVDVGKVEGADGLQHQPAFAIIQVGDYIQSINDQKITTKNELISAINKSHGESLVVGFEREGEQLKAKIIPIQTKSGEYQIGVWVRDNCQGLGTLTYVTKDGAFAALGHGISDMDTNNVMEISEGLLYDASILSIVAGKSGEPGEILGYIDYHSDYVRGTIEENNVTGIYGTVNGTMKDAFQAEPVEIATANEISMGKATILSSVTGSVEEYEVEIEQCNVENEEHKDMLVRVTDERLLDATGGILQGMSGSPIIQNGKLIGAVTHVLVNDPTRGYGIFIEEMMDAGE